MVRNRDSRCERARDGTMASKLGRGCLVSGLALLAACSGSEDDGAGPLGRGPGPSVVGYDGAILAGGDAGLLGMYPGMTMSPPIATRDAGSVLDAAAAARPDASLEPVLPTPDGGARDAGPDTGVRSASDAAIGGDGGLSPCSGGMVWSASDAPGAKPRVTGYGQIHVNVPVSTHIVSLTTTLEVPAQPTMASTLYAWPGLEPWPGGENMQPIGQGVLQPVLTWGTSCGSYAPKSPTGWWIAPQYVNPYTMQSAFYGCKGGKAIDVQVNDLLDIEMSLAGTVWSQQVVDRQNGQSTSFDMDLQGQAQNWALFEIEVPTRNKPASDVTFTSTVITFAEPSAESCQPSQRGMTDYFSAPQSSADGTKCCIARIILRAQGVAATSPNGP